METAFSTLSVLPTTADEVVAFTTKLSEELSNGDIHPFELMRIRKGIELVFENIKPLLSEMANDEAFKYPEKSFAFKSIKIEKSQSVKYDFSNCNHPKLTEITQSVENLTANRKQLETLLKTIKEPMQICDDSTGGEQVVVNPAIKYSTDILKVTFGK
jgi:hypothetical protein